MDNDFLSWLFLCVITFIMLFVVSISNAEAGHKNERELIKNAIIDNPNITCIEYLKMEEVEDEK